MSDEPTKDIAQKYDTQPTIQTVLERLAAFQTSVERWFDEVVKRFDEVETRFNEVDRRFEDVGRRFDKVERRVDEFESRVDVRLDRVEAIILTTRGEMLGLRADFTEFKKEVREHFPAAQ